MDEDTKSLARVRLERSREELAAVRLLIREGRYRIAVSRAYYAMFMVAAAALVVLGVSRSKHSAWRPHSAAAANLEALGHVLS